MLSSCCSNGSFFSSLLPAAAASASVPPQLNRDEAYCIRNYRKLRSLKGGSLCGRSYYQWRCATSAQPPPPPPNFGGDDSSGFQEEFSKIQDRVRIFFAVLFWMSLFFWASAWDGSDDSRNKKGPRFGKKFK